VTPWDIAPDRLAALTGEQDGRLAGLVVERERRLAPARLWVLELHDGEVALHDEDATERAAIGEVRTDRQGSNGFRLQLEGRVHLLHGFHPRNAREAAAAEPLAERHRALRLVPRPPEMTDRQYRRITGNRRAQQLLWRELWLAALAQAGARTD
jgi:hypothetical protein